jgi:hypothetical protein
MNIQVIATPCGDIVWTSGGLPGSVHDLKAARIWGILRELEAVGLITLGDKGYHGAVELVTHTRARKAGVPETGQPVPCKAAGAGRTRHCATENLAYPA